VADTFLAVHAMPGGGSGVVARTELVRRVGGFDCGLKILADWDLWVRLARESPLTTVADPLLAYRLHEGAMSWQSGQVRDELHRLEEKYASWRSASGLRLDRASFEMWLGDRAQRAGDRRVATSAYLRAAAVMGRPKAAVRLVESLLWPRAHILHDRYRRRMTSENHLTGVEAWLAPIRTVELAARVSERAAQAA
nr:hypothetical protein [Acidimicrobiia bacterium]